MYLEEALGTDTKVKLLRTLLQEGLPALSPTELATETGLARAGTYRAVQELASTGLLFGLRQGRVMLYAINVDHPWFGPLFELFREEKRRSKVAHLFPTHWNQIEPIVGRLRRAPGVQAVLLYGSATKPPLFPDADIDLLVVLQPGAKRPSLEAEVLGHPVSVLAMDVDALERKAKSGDAFLRGVLQRHVVLHRAPGVVLPWEAHAPGGRRA